MRGEENPFKHYIEDPVNSDRPVTMFDLTKVDQARAWIVYADSNAQRKLPIST